MTLRALVLLTIVTSASSAHAQDVLVWDDAPLYVEPSPDSDHVVIGSLKGSRDHNLGAVVEMELVSRDGDFLEVAPHDSSCRWRSFLSVDERLGKPRFYVRQSDVAPVLAQRWSKTFDDGTQIELWPGEPVGPLVRGTRSIDLSSATQPGAATLALDIPDDAVGLAFEPHAIWQPNASKPPGLEIATRRVGLGGHTVSLSWDVAFLGFEDRGGRALVQLDLGCEHLVVSVARKQVVPQRDHGPVAGSDVVGLRGSTPQPPTYVVRGTPITSVSGTQVAVAAYDFEVHPAHGDRTCLAFSVGADRVRHGDGTLTLCVPTRAVQVGEPSPPQTVPDKARAVRIRLDPPTVSGGADAAIAHRVLNRFVAGLYDCDRSQTRGTVTASFIVHIDGSVASVQATGISGVDGCVAGVLAGAHFPRLDSVGQVTLPIVFE